jgi:hypothetical protein
VSAVPRNSAHLASPQLREASKPARSPFSEFTQALGKQVLHLRLYREHGGFLCERELVEPDGTGVTQALPFHTAQEVEEFLLSDPHYARVKSGAMKLLHSFALEVGHESSSSELQSSNQLS